MRNGFSQVAIWPGATDEQCLSVLRQAAADSLLRRADKGLDTVIGEGGMKISGGEKQRLSIARALLREPDVEMTALALSDWTAGHAGSGVADGSADVLIDRRALAAYRARLAELDEELDEAHEWADDGRLARARAERDALLDEIGSATGLAGRSRRTSSTSERARVAVRKAVAAAIERIAEHDPATGRLLHDCIETGTVCRYRPDPARPVDWTLD